MKALLLIICLLIGGISPNTARPDTLVLDGRLQSRLEIQQVISFIVDKQVSEFNVRLSLPVSFTTMSVSQKISRMDLKAEPKPLRIEEEFDEFGNTFRVVTWKNLRQDARITLGYEARVVSELPLLLSAVPFPLTGVPEDVGVYLKPTKSVQSEDHEIAGLAKKLTEGAKTEHEAVTGVIHYVIDNVRYIHNPPSFDALHTLRAKSGNCTNIAHLSLALLRAVGIPARFVGGITLKEQWRIPIDQGNVIQSMGQGSHAWIEVYFPDLGWLPYDPQQSKQFTSSRHVKRAHGPDLDSMNDLWWAFPYVPRYSEVVEGKLLEDVVSVKVRYAEKAPKPYMVSTELTVKPVVTAKPPLTDTPLVTAKPVQPQEVIALPVPPSSPEAKLVKVLPFQETIEFGNMEFTAHVDLFRVVGNTGARIIDAETAEYVTSRHVYAQALRVDEEVKVDTVSLAMRKFGGDGAVYIDLVADDHGKPGYSGSRSDLLFLDSMEKRQGYYWVDFTFPRDREVTLKKGKYWIVLRRSGEAIMNWYYTPGKPYGGPFDTRTTSKGYEWEDILSYDFVFKVKGRK